MKTAVLGCGAIGGLVLSYLTQNKNDVCGVVQPYQKEPLEKEGFIIGGVRGDSKVKVRVTTKLWEKVDLAVFAVKINDLEKVIQDNAEFLAGAVALSTQNGVAADYILKKYFPEDRIITGIVMFGATFYPPNRVTHNFEGELIIGNIFNRKISGLADACAELQPVFKLTEHQYIRGAKYLKVFINLNNCLPAALGVSMQEAYSDLALAELAVDLNREAYQVVKKSGINLESLPTYPKERIEGLVNMETSAAAALFSKIMTSLSKEPLYGSILQSIQRGRRSEIDYINGEIVRMAGENNLAAPLNKKIVELVHRVEDTGKFLTKNDLFVVMKKA